MQSIAPSTIFTARCCLSAGKSAVNSNQAVLVTINDNMNNLDVNGKAALNRLVGSISAKALDAQAAQDMRELGEQLGFIPVKSVRIVKKNGIPKIITATSPVNVPYNLKNSCWGITVGVGAAAGLPMYPILSQWILRQELRDLIRVPSLNRGALHWVRPISMPA